MGTSKLVSTYWIILEDRARYETLAVWALIYYNYLRIPDILSVWLGKKKQTDTLQSLRDLRKKEPFPVSEMQLHQPSLMDFWGQSLISPGGVFCFAFVFGLGPNSSPPPRIPVPAGTKGTGQSKRKVGWARMYSWTNRNLPPDSMHLNW